MKYQDAMNEVRAKLPEEVANAIAAEIARLSELSRELTAACCALPLGSQAYRRAEEAVIKHRSQRTRSAMSATERSLTTMDPSLQIQHEPEPTAPDGAHCAVASGSELLGLMDWAWIFRACEAVGVQTRREDAKHVVNLAMQREPFAHCERGVFRAIRWPTGQVELLFVLSDATFTPNAQSEPRGGRTL